MLPPGSVQGLRRGAPGFGLGPSFLAMPRIEITKDGQVLAAVESSWTPARAEILVQGETSQAVYIPRASLGPIVKFHFAQGTPLASLLKSCHIFVDSRDLGAFSLIHGRREKDRGEVVARSLVFIQGSPSLENHEQAYLDTMSKI